jgi:nucleoside-diphosphate-sugar epimerase
VIGASGFIGRAVVARLIVDGADVLSFSSHLNSIFKPLTGIIAENFDLPSDVDGIIYLSQSPYYRQVPDTIGHLWGVNVVSALRVAELARKRGVQCFIYASTGNVYSPGFLPHKENDSLRRDDWYALSKVHAEEGLSLYRSDLSTMAVRIFGVYGPGQTDKLVPNLAKSILAGQAIKLAPHPCDAEDSGGLRISLSYIDDVVDVLLQLIEKPGPEVINLAGPEVLSIKDIAEQIGKQCGVMPIFEFAHRSRSFDLVADVSRLLEVCSPRFTPFSEGVKRTFRKEVEP